MANVTRQSYARGIADYLQRSGVTSIPSANLVKEASAQASRYISVEPSVTSVPHAEAAKVAQYIAAYDNQLRATGKFASTGRGATISQSADHAYGDLMEMTYKFAMENLEAEVAAVAAGGDGGLVGVDNISENTLANSVDPLANLDAARPENYALVGQGNANISEPQSARTGVEMPHPSAPVGVGGAATNSVVEATKAASFRRFLSKLAETSLITDTPKAENTIANSVDPLADLEAARPENYALVGQGNANIGESAAAQVGSEQPHPLGPEGVGGAATNSVVDASKTARWNAHFAEVSQEIGPYLPSNMPMEQKVATVKQCMSMEPHEVRHQLQKVAAAYSPRHTLGDALSGLSSLNRR
jgi:hypothetical protein